jgi:hypothetical protein
LRAVEALEVVEEIIVETGLMVTDVCIKK